jgi:hypothetical protein
MATMKIIATAQIMFVPVLLSSSDINPPGKKLFYKLRLSIRKPNANCTGAFCIHSGH